MTEPAFCLTLASEGEEIMVVRITGGRGLQNRLRNMGLKEGTVLKVLHCYRPGPCIVLFGNTRLVLGRGMIRSIFVKKCR